MLDALLRLVLDLPLFLLQTLHLALQALHAADYRVQGGQGLVWAVSVGERVVGGIFEGREDMFFFALDDALDGLEVSAGELVRKSEEWLVLYIDIDKAQAVVSEGQGIARCSQFSWFTKRRWFSALSFVDVSSAAMAGNRQPR